MKKPITVLLMMLLLCNLSSEAFGWGEHYHYRDGRYFSSAGWWGLGGFVTGLAVGAYVTSLPPRYETVEVAGVPYYYADGYYYQAGPNGYVVVAPPAAQGQVTGAPPSAWVYIGGTLLGILLLGCIILVLKKIFT
jgi:hypothetical protein